MLAIQRDYQRDCVRILPLSEQSRLPWQREAEIIDPPKIWPVREPPLCFALVLLHSI
jgi:hypothetical protein